jgi:hypothetical protein
MNHTKEPWEARRDPSYYGIVSEVYAGDKFILGTGGVHSPSELEANTKRIVACVNACAGITNEALEAGVVHSALINFEESLDLEKGEKFCFYDIPVLEDV